MFENQWGYDRWMHGGKRGGSVWWMISATERVRVIGWYLKDRDRWHWDLNKGEIDADGAATGRRQVYWPKTENSSMRSPTLADHIEYHITRYDAPNWANEMTERLRSYIYQVCWTDGLVYPMIDDLQDHAPEWLAPLFLPGGWVDTTRLQPK